MASSNPLSAFGGTSGGSWNLTVPQYRSYKPVIPVHHDHSIIHNFISDVATAGRGFFPGLYHLGKAVGEAAIGQPHDLANIGRSAYHAYGNMYGPAFHGHFGLTLHRMGQHPLQPLLDALSVATLPIGAAGAAVKGASLGAHVGERVGLVGAERAAQLGRAADFFRPRSVAVGDQLGMPAAFRHYSGNPTNRGFQHLSVGTQGILAKAMPTLFGEGGKLRDLTPTGFQDRWLALQRSSRAHAQATMIQREVLASRNLIKNPNLTQDDIANALAPHIHDVFQEHAYRLPEDKLLAKGKLAEGWRFVAKRPKHMAYPADKTPAAFKTWVESYGGRLMTDKVKRAQRDANGNYLVVRDKTIKEILDEAHHTYGALHALYTTPTRVWKWMVLATAPRYFVNNVVGNGLMYAMAANPVDTTRAMYKAISQIHGERVARRSLSQVEKAQRSITGDWVDRQYLATTQGFGQEATRDLKIHEHIKNPIAAKVIAKAEGGLFGVTHFASDTIPRRALINMYVKGTKEYRGIYHQARLQGMGAKEAHNFAGEGASSNLAVRDLVTRRVDNVLGQYHHFNNIEKGIKAFIPFYSWDRAIMRHAFHMAAERPAVAQAMNGAGQMGQNDVKKALGHVPDFLQGVIPLGDHSLGPLDFLLGSSHAGRKKILATQGVNPYATIPDVVDFATTLIKGQPRAGEALATQINPLITGAIQHYTGQSLLSGKKLKPHTGLLGGLVGDVLSQTAQATPPARLIQTVISGTPHPKINPKTGLPKSPLLYRGDLHQQAVSMLGFPVKDINIGVAHTLYNQQEGIKVPHPPKAHTQDITAFKKTVRKTARKARRSRAKPSLPHLGRPRRPRISHSGGIPGLRGVTGHG